MHGSRSETARAEFQCKSSTRIQMTIAKLGAYTQVRLVFTLLAAAEALQT
jgi:hypothetical protein